MKIVFLDYAMVNPGDISWAGIAELGAFEAYEKTPKELAVQRLQDADAVIIDSVEMDRRMMESCPKLKYIGIAATGFNHVDLEAARELGIAVTNVPAYAAEAVAQHAIALLLYITNRIQPYNEAVSSGGWRQEGAGIYAREPLMLLSGKSIGIIGYGAIGSRVADIAEALGMKVNIYSRAPQAAISSDVVSLNCPLTRENSGMVDRNFIDKMKDGAILINTARGKLIDEKALAEALISGKLAAAGLDVMAQEPPCEDNPLIKLDNCFITPHIAFIPVETRRTVVDTCVDNLKSFLDGGSLNRLV